MASEPSTSQPDGASVAPPDQLLVNLQVISPSVGVNHPLLFPGLPAATTIQQLKGKIRGNLPVLSPADEDQRLIYRGRALTRDTDTLQDIFGLEALQTNEQQSMHLVIKDGGDSRIPTPSVRPSVRGLSPANGAARQHLPGHPHFGPQPPPGFARRSPLQTTSNPFPQPQIPPAGTAPEQTPFQTPFQTPLAGEGLPPQLQALRRQQEQNMSQQWMAHLQRDAMTRALVNQNQRGRAHIGRRGIGDNGSQPPDANSRRSSPAPGHTTYRETVGPNGQTYHVETTVRTSVQSAQGGLSPADVQNIIRGADVSQATQAMADAIQRSASGASLHNRPFTQPGVTTPMFPAARAGSLPRSDRATPDPGTRSASVGRATPTVPQPLQPGQALEVYILSSPEGPRGLLVNTSTSDTYYTPRMRAPASVGRTDATAFSSEPQMQQLLRDRVVRERAAEQMQMFQHHRREEGVQGQATRDYNAAAPQEQPAQGQPQPQPIRLAHPNNPVPAGVAPLVLQMWPHIWLLVRLAFFVWILAVPGASWSRWVAILSLASLVFLYSTGLLNRFADHAWRPLARHLENLLPALDQPNRPRALAGNEQRAPGDDLPGRDPDPARLAARLVADRQGEEPWLTGQMRRLERAGLLFLASIAPGVAERHIANLEAEARAERERVEAEARASAEAEATANAAAEAATAEDGEEGSGGVENDAAASSNETSEQQAVDGQENTERRDEQANQEQLVAV